MSSQKGFSLLYFQELVAYVFIGLQAFFNAKKA